MIVHVGTFKLVDKSKKQEAVDLINKLRDIVPGMVDYKVGANMADTPTSFDVCLIGVFEDKAALDAYNNHPVHVDIVGPGLVEMCDYEIMERMGSCDFEI